MKKLRWLAAMTACMLLTTSAGAQIYRGGNTLSGAISSGKVSAKFRGVGGSSGGSVKVSVAKRPKAGPGDLVLTIPPGTRLGSSDSSAQSMVVARVLGEMMGGQSYAPESTITVTSGKPVTYVLEAYCAEFEKDNPSSSTRFKMGKPDPVLACILKTADSRGLSTRATQAAVWIYTDHIDRDYMSEKFPVDDDEWKAARSVVKHCTHH